MIAVDEVDNVFFLGTENLDPTIRCLMYTWNSCIGASASKVPKRFGCISDDITLFESSKRRRLEARNFSVYFSFNSLYNTWKHKHYRISVSEYYEWLFGPVNSSGLSRNGPWALIIAWMIYSEIDKLFARSARIQKFIFQLGTLYPHGTMNAPHFTNFHQWQSSSTFPYKLTTTHNFSIHSDEGLKPSKQQFAKSLKVVIQPYQLVW